MNDIDSLRSTEGVATPPVVSDADRRKAALYVCGKADGDARELLEMLGLLS